MNAEELIEAVSKMTPGECPFCRKTDRVVIDQDYSRESIRATVKCTRCRVSIHGDWADDSPSCREDFMRGKQALVGHWNQALQSLISERDAALARVAELEARCDPQNTTPMIIRDLCELDPADSENLNVICVHVDDLRLVLNERMKPCEHDFDEAPGQGYFCRNCGVPKS